MPGISVIVPVSERPTALDGLYAEFAPALRDAGYTFEFLFVVGPEHAPAVAALRPLEERGEPVRIVRLGQPMGETALLREGAERAVHPILLTLPAYPRIEASTLPSVIEPVLGGAAVSVARRWPRRDSWLNRLQNQVLHVLLRPVAGASVRDVACGVRAFRREVFEALPVYGESHRFLPILAARDGYRVDEVDATQHPADHQPRIYPPRVYLSRVLDLLGLFFLLRFTERPLRFFGTIGGGSVLVGGVILLVMVVQRFGGQAMADRPLLLLGALAVVLGVQAIALGLVGELVVHLNAPHRRGYRLAAPAGAQEEPESNPPPGRLPEPRKRVSAGTG